FNFGAYCGGRAREVASELGSGLQVSMLGNPVAADWVEVEVKGAQGQPLKLQLTNTLGEVSSQQMVEVAGTVERHKIGVGRLPGVYFLQVMTPAQNKTIKVIRQQ
ncbi:T9SS type A sorting domain-containing protein, partial [Spirosoma validum]